MGAKEERTFTEKRLAQEFNVTIRTLVFYSLKGLLRPCKDASHRIYSADDRSRLELILQAKELGFSLREIAMMIAEQAPGPLGYRLRLDRARCEDKIMELEQQKRAIEASLSKLRRLCLHLHRKGSE